MFPLILAKRYLDRQKGVADGVASLDTNVRLSAAQIPLVGAGVLVAGGAGVTRYTRTPGGPTSTFVPLNAQGTCSFIGFDRTTKIDRIGVSITSAGEAGSLVRLLIHGPVPANRQLSAGATPLVLNAGTVAGDGATGYKEITIDVTLAPGVYTLSAVAEAAATTRPTLTALTAASGGNPWATFLPAVSPTFTYNGYSGSSYTDFANPPITAGPSLNTAIVFLRVVGE